jgi:hypothetical protein
VKLAVAAPAGTLTDAGTARLALLLERATKAPLLGAAALRVAVQVALPGVFMVAGAQAKDVRLGVIPPLVMVPPVPDDTRAPPAALTAKVFATAMAVLVTPEAMVMFTDAIAPFEMVFGFIPVARHVYVPAPAVQVSVLAALVAAAPADVEIDVTAEGEYVNVH